MSTTPSHHSDTPAFHTYLEYAATGQDIAAAVAQEALDYDNPTSFFEDLARHGCVSGAV